jgi:hypothetical protein
MHRTFHKNYEEYLEQKKKFPYLTFNEYRRKKLEERTQNNINREEAEAAERDEYSKERKAAHQEELNKMKEKTRKTAIEDALILEKLLTFFSKPENNNPSHINNPINNLSHINNPISRIKSPYNNIENDNTIVKMKENLKSSINRGINLLTNITDVKKYLKNQYNNNQINNLNINTKNIDELKNILKNSIEFRINSMPTYKFRYFISRVNNSELAEKAKLAKKNKLGGAPKSKSKKPPAKKPKRKSPTKK